MDVVSDKQYDVFRKKFHIPLKWRKNNPITDLIQFKYATTDLVATLSNITNLFNETEYKSTDNNQMLHDYLHYLLIDILIKNDIPFIKESELKAGTEFYKYLKCTPDLIIKGKGLLDVYVGYEDVQFKIDKYNKFSSIFKNIIILTPININEKCKLIGISEDDIKYINENYQIFKTELNYWMSCLKINKILKNDVENVTLLNFNFSNAENSIDYESKRINFKDSTRLNFIKCVKIQIMMMNIKLFIINFTINLQCHL